MDPQNANLDRLTLDRLTKTAYEAFVASVREFAPQAVDAQPPWDRMPETLKRPWRSAVQAALDAAARTNA